MKVKGKNIEFNLLRKIISLIIFNELNTLIFFNLYYRVKINSYINKCTELIVIISKNK